jgi:hypothetical protein
VYVQTFPASDFKFQISSPAVTHPVWLSNPLRLSMYAPYGALTFQVTPQPAFTLGTPSVGPVMVADNGPGGIRSWDATRDGSRVLGLSTGTGDATTPELRVVLNWFEELKQRVPSK